MVTKIELFESTNTKTVCMVLFYINDLPKTIIDKATPILFANDTSLLINSFNKSDLHTKLTNAFEVINDWLNTNLLFINFSKTHYIQFATKKQALNSYNNHTPKQTNRNNTQH